MARGFFGDSARHAKAGRMSTGNRTSGPNRKGGRPRSDRSDRSGE